MNAETGGVARAVSEVERCMLQFFRYARGRRCRGVPGKLIPANNGVNGADMELTAPTLATHRCGFQHGGGREAQGRPRAGCGGETKSHQTIPRQQRNGGRLVYGLDRRTILDECWSKKGGRGHERHSEAWIRGRCQNWSLKCQMNVEDNPGAPAGEVGGAINPGFGKSRCQLA